MKKSLEPSEHQIQSAYIEWVKLSISKYPVLKYLFAIPNGGYKLPIGVAMKLKREGLIRGPLDIMLPARSKDYSGLWIEFKTSIGKLTPEQVPFREFVISQGYYVAICRTPEEGINETLNYLKNLL